MKALKKPLSIDEQIKLLKYRNLRIENENFARDVLSKVNYYRLSAYGLGLHKNDIYKDGVCFDDIYQLYEFDAKFRYALLEEIEKIEVMVRTKIAYFLAINYGTESYLEKELFLNKSYHDKFIKDLNDEKNRQKNSAFVKHHLAVYGGKMPVWVVVELFSFGMLSHFYSNMRNDLQSEIAKNFHTKSIYMRSWLKALVELRNLCAHYGRVYNRIFTSTPKLYKEHKGIKKDRVFAIILVIHRFLTESDYHHKGFVVKLHTLLEHYKKYIKLPYIGFPVEWEKVLNECRVSKH